MVEIGSKRRRLVRDIIILALAVIPVAACIVLKILTMPPSNGIDISGPLIYFTIKTPIQDLTVTESQINSFAVILRVFQKFSAVYRRDPRAFRLFQPAFSLRAFPADVRPEYCRRLGDTRFLPDNSL